MVDLKGFRQEKSLKLISNEETVNSIDHLETLFQTIFCMI